MSDERAPHVFETPGGLSVSYLGRLLYSSREPARLPRRLAAACDPGPSRLHLVPSPLLWYGIPELLASMGPGSAVLCVETDPELARLARERMPPGLAADKRLAFLSAPAPSEAVAAARSLGRFRSCSTAALTGGMALDEGGYASIAAALSTEFESAWRNRAALMILGDRWAKNILDNLAALPAIGPSPLPRFPGAAVVCGAGPSLEEALPLIARLRSRGRIAVVACDTALGTLLAAGVEVDLVVCLEGQAHNLADFTCLGSRPAALAADLSSHPAAFRAVAGEKFLTFARITRSPFLSRVEAALEASGLPFLPLPPLGSVGVHAARVAALLARGPLLAAGLDFSFEPGKTHARGCPSLLAEERRLSRLTRWPGQYAASFRDRTMELGPGGSGGKRALSDPILLSYAALLADGSGEGFYDLRGGGPPIGGRRVTLAEAESIALSQADGSLVLPGGAARTPGLRRGADRAAEAVKAFFRDEAGRLEELRLSMRGPKAADREILRRLVMEADYLWWSFPDQDRASELPQDFLNRLVPQAEYWARRLRELERSL